MDPGSSRRRVGCSTDLARSGIVVESATARRASRRVVLDVPWAYLPSARLRLDKYLPATDLPAWCRREEQRPQTASR